MSYLLLTGFNPSNNQSSDNLVSNVHVLCAYMVEEEVNVEEDVWSVMYYELVSFEYGTHIVENIKIIESIC